MSESMMMLAPVHSTTQHHSIGPNIEILTAPDRARAAKLKLKQVSQSAPTSQQVSQSAPAKQQGVGQSAFAISHAFAILSSASNITTTWNIMRKNDYPKSTHYLFRTSL